MFRTIGQKLTAIAGAAVALGFLAVVGVLAHLQERNILQQNERGMLKVTESVTRGMRTVMLSGHAGVAVLFADQLKAVGGVTDFRILRTDGLEAFKDNKTIHRVNEIRGDEDFLPRRTEARFEVLPADLPELRRAIDGDESVSMVGEDGGVRTLTFLRPITNDEACHKCHGDDHAVRGVVKLTTSLAAVDAEIARTWQQSAMILAGALAVVLGVMVVVLRRSIVRPIEVVSRAMHKVAKGSMAQVVPVIGRDELAQMAGSFNDMAEVLRETYEGFRSERNKLETILLGAGDGIVATNSDGAVVLVNPVAARMLDKPAQRIIDEGLANLLDDPARMEERLAAADREVFVDIVIYRERIFTLSVATIRASDDRLIGRAALLRDITAEKQLERTLVELSSTDALTGLANRRLLDETLDREVQRAQLHGRQLSVLMIDVDHFKRFNDTYGHDQGDRVLQAVAQTMRDSVRASDLACRYGGEEFTVIATETSQEGGLRLAERIRAAVEATTVDGLKVTVSIGVAGIVETASAVPGQLIERADSALYEAKRTGRNRAMGAPHEEAEA